MLDQEFKTAVANILSVPMEKVGKIQDKTGNVIREMEKSNKQSHGNARDKKHGNRN